ncbi:hypothetical protein [Prochlorococcus marinus]|uniref:hypothetical protein n=1 Tax=Prochlorococcus marinus TaxID=1219 RepID=UPI0007B340E4|nr:hypothetical protein [Prochlorococcus marinus]KZR75869.1 hypothetical protein PMIT1320_00863 [Prochlorococcus marinus str. MIT 1320]
MGHTIEVHLSSYARFTPDATADLYAQVNAGTAQVNRNGFHHFGDAFSILTKRCLSAIDA